MKQKITLGLLALLIIAIIAISGCTQKVQIPNEPTYQFDIYYSFGVGEINILDTKNNLYTKDMVCDPSKEYDFKLTDYEKTEIHNSILQNDLFNIKDDFTENCDESGICQEVTPLSTATLIITIDEKIETIKYSANYIFPDDPELQKFQNVVMVIQDIISQKEEEMNIKPPTCGYL
jgi:hypothetical protein